MQQVRRSAVSLGRRWSALLKSRSSLASPADWRDFTSVAGAGFTEFSSVATRSGRSNSVDSALIKLGHVRSTAGRESVAKVIFGDEGTYVPLSVFCSRECVSQSKSRFLHAGINGANTQISLFSRSFASRSTEKKRESASETKKDVSTVEDPFDAPTYNIPQKPVTFVEGASYSLIILAGLGIAAAAAYAVFNELIFQPKEYKIFNLALKRIQDDGQVSEEKFVIMKSLSCVFTDIKVSFAQQIGQVRVRIGSPITGYGQESRNRAARQRIPHRIWTDEDGMEHIEVNFYIRGPHGAGKVFCRMFKDKVEKQWKFTSLIVQIVSPSPAHLLLESYVPA